MLYYINIEICTAQNIPKTLGVAASNCSEKYGRDIYNLYFLLETDVVR